MNLSIKPDIVYITMSGNENGLFPMIVTVSSLMESSNKCFYIFFIIVDNINNKAFQKIKYLEKIYNRLTINIIDHSPKTDGLKTIIPYQNKWPLMSWYRLWLPELLPNIDRIIHLDYDCIIKGDLNEMYNINMANLNIRGVIDITPSNNDRILRNDKYICAGVLLMNLKRMRNHNLSRKYEQAIMKYRTLLNFVDQSVINSVDIENNDLLPLKYGILFISGLTGKQYYNRIRYKQIYKINDFVEALENPVVLHLVTKPFRSFVNNSHCIRWWEIAMISCYSEEIKAKYSIHEKYLPLLNQSYIKEKKIKKCIINDTII